MNPSLYLLVVHNICQHKGNMLWSSIFLKGQSIEMVIVVFSHLMFGLALTFGE